MSVLIKYFIKDYKNTDNLEVRNNYGKFSSIVGIIFNVFLFVIKLIAGLLSGSVAIIADSINNLSDASSSVISLIGFKLSSKPADADHPYGHGRYEYISALIVACLIIAIGIEVFRTSVDKIIHPTEITISTVSIVILGISILVKLYMMFFNRKIGKLINSKTLIATSDDSRNDVITTSAVLISILVFIFAGFNIDGYIGLIVSIFILISGVGLVKDTLNPILGQAPDKELVDSITDIILSKEGILGIHDLIIHDYGPGKKFASVHCEVDSQRDVLEAHDQIDNIEREVFEKTHVQLVIHYDPIITNDSLTSDIRIKLTEIVNRIAPTMSVHDVRVVPGPTHTNIVFDVVIPHSVTLTEKELRQIITDEVHKIDTSYNCVMTFDQDFTSSL